MAKQTFWQKIGRLFSGNKGGSKKTAPKPRQNKDEREVVSSKSYTSPRRVVLNTMRGGGGGAEKPKPTYKSMAEATSNKSSLSKLDSALKKDVPDPKRAAALKSQERTKANLNKAKDTLRDNAKYLGNDTERETIGAIKKWNEANKQQKKEFNERTNHKYDVKYWEEKGDKKKAQEARIRVKSGENTSDVVAEELAVKYHPTAGSAARGAASGATFGASELAIKAQAKHDKERAKNEQYYQENKNKTAETVGELAGAFASFGATAGATDRLGAKVVSKVAPNAAERLAETKGVQLLAKRGVNKAVEKGLVGEASEELIKQVGKEKAKKIVAAVGNDIVQNATTGLLYDFNKASAAHEVGSKEWWKEMGRSAAFNAAVTGGIAGGAILGGNKKLAAEEAMNLFNRKNKQAAEDAFKNYMWAERGVGAGNLPNNRGRLFGESIDDRFAREKADELGRLGKAGYVKQAPDAKVSLNRKRRADVVLSNERPLKADDDIDSLIDDALDSATTVEDYMELGFSRAEAEILARPIRVDNAAQEEPRFNPFLSDEWSAQQSGMPIRKGNIKPLAENLKTNELISRSRNAEWRTLPRSAERMDTSVEGLTKRLEELKAQKPQTDKEARELRTKINDVEDYLDRAKWRKEGGSNMDAMRKAYQGEYDGFDMRASTNSHQSDVLEGKVKGKTATIVEMSPDEYMERAYRQIFKKSSEKGAKYADHLVSIDEDVQKYAEAMRNGDKFPLPYLDFTNAGQEGRHRAMAAKMAGIDKIPVVVIDDATNPKALIDDAAEALTKNADEPIGRRGKVSEMLADVDDFDEFVKTNAKHPEVKAYVVDEKNGVKGLEKLWRDTRISNSKQGVREMSSKEVDDILERSLPDSTRLEWFQNENSLIKPKFAHYLAKDPDLINAGMNVAYRNYVDSTLGTPLPFDEWLVTPQKMYRGTHGQGLLDEDIFSAFTPDRRVAEKFAGKSKDARVEEITIRPIDTYGSYAISGEQEVLVPKEMIENAKATAKSVDAGVEATSQNYKVSLNRKRKTDVALPNERAAESVEPQSVPSMRQKEYTLKVKYKSGKTYTRKVNALSDTEALDIITKNKGVDSARIVGSSEITPKGTKPAAENLQTKELSQEEKRNNILNFIGEGDETTPAVETTAKGAKPEAKILTSPYEETIANNPKTVDELGDHIGVKHEKVSNKEKTRDFWGSFRTKFVDSLDAYEQWNKQFLKNNPQLWALNNGAIDKLRRHQAQAARSIGDVQLGWNGQPLKNEDGSIAKSLKAIYDGLDEEKENLFERYLLLRHAPARIAEGKPIFKGTFENADKCIEEAEKILADNPDFAKRADELYRYTRNELQNRVDAGLLPQEVADDWFKRYPNYVPTGRVGEFRPDEDIWEVAHDLARNGNTVKAGEIKSASGSDLDVRSIKEQLSEATTRNWRDMSLNNLLRRMYGEKIGKQLAAEADGGLATVLDNTVNLKSGKGGKYYAEVFEDGKATRVEIEKRFYDAIKDLNKNGRVGDAIDFASDVAAKLSTPFKNVVTSWNPIFMVKNGMRDFPEAIINSRNTKEFMECMDAARRDLYGVDGGGMWTQALRNQGVSQANFVNLDEALTKGGNNIFAKGADKFATLQESVETYPRLVEFMATIKKLNGGTLPESLDNIPMEWLDVAAANAADVTVNFGRSGSIGKMLNRGFVPFFNPSVQGFDKFIRNLSQQPSGKALLGTIAKAFALGTGATAINNMLLSDNPYYQQIAAREKATNIIIACPIKYEDGKVSLVDKDEANIFIKIPKSRFAAAYSIPMVNVANDNKMGWAEMIKVAGDQVAPVNPVESNILAPFALAAKNETWYGTPIVSQGIENKTNPSQEYDANTSLIGKALGKATSKLPKELQISPKKADYILDATTGVFGDFILPALTPSRQGDGGFVNKYITHPAGNVVKRAFAIDANTQNDLSTRFYDELQKATDNSNSEIGTKEDKEEYKRLNAYSKETAGINKAIRYLQGSDSPTKQKDIYELQKVRNQLMQDALDGKGVPTSEKMLDAVQKYVGTTYAVDSFGSSADKDAMKVYGEAVYGNLSEDEMKKRIDSDTNFYNGVRAIGGLEDKLKNEGLKGTSVLSRAVALASANASDDLFGAYECTKQSRTETANKMTRAKNYIKNGGSEDEFIKLEKVRKDIGKLPDEEKDSELDKIHAQLANGEINYEEYYNKQGEIEYNANISRVGLATSLAQANAPQRAYKLYDLKDRNIQKGINLAAMGYSARDYRKMAKAVDTSGNGYLSKQEVIDYVANSGVKDKATLFDALYPYDIKYNPFGRATNYSVSQAAEAGNRSGIASIGGSNNDFKISANSGSSGSSYGGYGGYRSYGYGGGGGRKAKVPTIKAKSMAAATKKSKGTTVKLEPPTPKTTKVTTKFKKYEV